MRQVVGQARSRLPARRVVRIVSSTLDGSAPTRAPSHSRKAGLGTAALLAFGRLQCAAARCLLCLRRLMMVWEQPSSTPFLSSVCTPRDGSAPHGCCPHPTGVSLWTQAVALRAQQEKRLCTCAAAVPNCRACAVSQGLVGLHLLLTPQRSGTAAFTHGNGMQSTCCDAGWLHSHQRARALRSFCGSMPTKGLFAVT